VSITAQSGRSTRTVRPGPADHAPAGGRREFLSPRTIRHRVESGQPAVSAIFVTPYPPGFSVLVPGQEFSKNTLHFMDALDSREMHGYDSGIGYGVFARKHWTP
jgi:arginine/lysine/ornithine decarboxylase